MISTPRAIRGWAAMLGACVLASAAAPAAAQATGTAFQAVAPGSYSVKIELTGFRTHEQKHHIVNASGFVI